jgi:hypothetical protein
VLIKQIVALLTILLLVPVGAVSMAPEPVTTVELTVDQAVSIAGDAYIYGYPLVTMDLTRRVMTNVAEPQPPHAPMGQFAHSRTYPTVAFRGVTAPNADTLYSTAWLDVSKEPYILSIPQMWGRYFLLPMLDGWTNVFQAAGKATSGTMPHRIGITGPAWRGTLPTGVKEYRSPTNMVWIIGGTYCTGTAQDVKAVHLLQDKISLTPLSAYGGPYTPPASTVDPNLDMKTVVRDQVNAMDVATFFNKLAELMRDNPPAEADAPVIARMATIGLVPGQRFDVRKLGPEIAKALEVVPRESFAKIMAQFKQGGTNGNGWRFTTQVGVYGRNYMQRALITAIGLGASRPEDVVYPVSETDGNGEPYDGASAKYVMHFEKGQMPPANAFWSLTLYDVGYYFVANRLNRYALSPRNKLKYNRDGSVDLYIQKKSPGPGKESNWLPAPDGRFILMLRLYWPRQQPPSILDGTWKFPQVKTIQ